jgi:hypothetical protein
MLSKKLPWPEFNGNLAILHKHVKETNIDLSFLEAMKKTDPMLQDLLMQML